MQRLIPAFLLLLVLLATFLAYRPGLTGPFLFDDSYTIENNQALAIPDLSIGNLKRVAFSASAGPLARPISMMSFAVNRYTTGLDPYFFKLTNVVIHLFNGVGIFVLTNLLLNIYRKRFKSDYSATHAKWVGLVVTAAWLLHQFNLTSVLYVVQRMTSLSALFSIWGLSLFLWGRTRLYEGQNGMLPILASLLLFTPLAALSKENGALLPVFMLLAEIIFFNFITEKPSARRFLVVVYLFFVAVPASVVLVYTGLHPEWVLNGYQTREFSLLERLLTEARVLWFYLGQIVLPDTSQMALFHDDIVTSKGLLQPLSTFFSLLGIAALLSASFLLRKKAPIAAFGVLFFLAGQTLESTFIALEIAHEHRNYFPQFGILLIIMFYLLPPVRKFVSLRLRYVGAFLFIALLAFDTFTRADQWSSYISFYQAEAENHPQSLRANDGVGQFFANLKSSDAERATQYYLLARIHYEKTWSIDKNDAHGLIGLIILNSSRGMPIETAWLVKLEYLLEHAKLRVDTPYLLLGLVKCRIDNVCRISNNEIETLLDAALRNKMLKGMILAGVYAVQGNYLMKVTHTPQAAVAAMYKAQAAAPQNPDYRADFARLLFSLGRYEEAREQLVILKKIDKLQTHRNEFESLNAQLPIQFRETP